MVGKSVIATFTLLLLLGELRNTPAQAPQPPQNTLPRQLLPVDGAAAVSPLVGSNAIATPMDSSGYDPTVRVKDITFVEGDRVNHLSGPGLVFGLAGTGGRSEQTRTMATNFFLRTGLPTQNPDTQNMSAVLVSAKMPAYARVGEKIEVLVSVADDASSLRGGYLNKTVLRGLDDEIYAIADGPIIAGGVAAQGGAASVQMNHPTVGVCQATVEREINCDKILRNGHIRLVLRNKSYATATRIASALNEVSSYDCARAIDSGTVDVTVPKVFLSKLPDFIASIGNLRVTPDLPARVVINQKTGTIVMGHTVKISRVLFSSGNIVIATSESPVASQPAPFSQGQTAILPRTSIDIVETDGTYNVWREGVTVGDLANALNALGVSPSTFINILTTLRNQGSLQAELVIE